uniref:Cation_ATPase_C domain-containing protein n=1 Tax=Macrostomum lignano TaxID=282301 RepID=A0A1I8IQA6_9PLAT
RHYWPIRRHCCRWEGPPACATGKFLGTAHGAKHEKTGQPATMETQSGSSVGGVSGASAESGDTEEVLSMRSSRLECLTAGLVLADLALVTHQLALDASSGESSGNKNYTVTAPPKWQQGRNQFFTAVLIFSVIFVIESVWRNGRNLMKHRRLLALD